MFLLHTGILASPLSTYGLAGPVVPIFILFELSTPKKLAVISRVTSYLSNTARILSMRSKRHDQLRHLTILSNLIREYIAGIVKYNLSNLIWTSVFCKATQRCEIERNSITSEARCRLFKQDLSYLSSY